MPLNRGGHVERVSDRHLYFIAAVHADDWAEDRRGIAVGMRRFSLNKRVPTGHNR
jgi:hypothetical protein